jgi:hypothetical protein
MGPTSGSCTTHQIQKVRRVPSPDSYGEKVKDKAGPPTKQGRSDGIYLVNDAGATDVVKTNCFKLDFKSDDQQSSRVMGPTSGSCTSSSRLKKFVEFQALTVMVKR